MEKWTVENHDLWASRLLKNGTSIGGHDEASSVTVEPTATVPSKAANLTVVMTPEPCLASEPLDEAVMPIDDFCPATQT